MTKHPPPPAGVGDKIMKNSNHFYNNNFWRKLHSQSGIAWLVVVLAVACALMILLIVGEPALKKLQSRMASFGCVVALNKAQTALDTEDLQAGSHGLSYESAKAIMEKNQWAMETLCPGGGDCYLIPDPDADLLKREFDEGKTRYVVVCGLHDDNDKRRTRLNAQNVLEQVQVEVKHKRLIGVADPASAEVTLNGKTMTAYQRDVEMTAGTYLTPGQDGTVAYYLLDDDGVSRFSFADENYCANWKPLWGWSGNAFDNTGNAGDSGGGTDSNQ